MTKLEEAYLLYNSRYFRNSLPPCKIMWADIPHFGEYQPIYPKAYKTEKEARDAIKSGEIEKHVVHRIRLGRWTKRTPRQWRFTLLHEMAHVKLRNESGGYHGHKFQREMKRLAKLGAFNGLW